MQAASSRTLLPPSERATRKRGGNYNTTTLPNHADGSCLARETSGMIFDAAALGHWCCGSFEQPDAWNVIEDGESETWFWKTWVIFRSAFLRMCALSLIMHHNFLHRPIEWRSQPLDTETAAVARAQARGPSDSANDDSLALALERPRSAGVAARTNRNVSLWQPFWDGHEVFNLHVHSKKLFRYASLGDAAPAPTASPTPSITPTPSFGAPQGR